MFSSRRASIGPLTARLAHEYEAQFGRAPDARALASLRQWANHATRRAKHGAAARLRRAGAPLGGARHRSRDRRPRAVGAPNPQHQRQGSPTCAHRRSAAPARHPAAPAAQADPQPQPGPLTAVQAARLMAEAVAAVQQAQPTWTEADLIRHLGERLPAAVGAMTAPRRRRAAPRPGPPGAGQPRQSCCPRRNGRASPTACAAPTARACTSRTARRDTPPARSSTWKTGCSPTRRKPAPRAWTRPPRRACSAQTRRSWRRNCARRTTSPHAKAQRQAQRDRDPACASTRPPPRSGC